MSQPAVPPSYGARQAQPMENMVRQAMEGLNGWDWFKPDPGTAERGSWAEGVKDRAAEAAAALARLYEGPGRKHDFKLVLEFMADQTVRRPMWTRGQPDPLAYIAFREGQNGAFFMLLQLLATGREEQSVVREGT